MVFFGYTQCPDVCPTSMAELAEVKKLLGKDGDKLQGIFITVDPERDTPEVLKAYMANFDPTFLALRPTPEQLAASRQGLQDLLQKGRWQDPTSYTMDHSAGSYVYDTKGASAPVHPLRLRVPKRWLPTFALLIKDKLKKSLPLFSGRLWGVSESRINRRQAQA